jgi:DNA-binding XRE family transcriptional regulator
MTMSRLAEESGISLSAVSLIATGRKVPSLVTALRVVEVLDVEVEDIFSDDSRKR